MTGKNFSLGARRRLVDDFAASLAPGFDDLGGERVALVVSQCLLAFGRGLSDHRSALRSVTRSASSG